jgi:peptide/nickel transport system substrate-binding protein
MHRARLVLVLLAVVMAVSVMPLAAQESATLTMGLSNNIDVLDPNLTTFSSVGMVMEHVFDPLVWEDPLGTYHPGLATSWSVNEDATEYTFDLRTDVIFHDGTPFNAEAVKYTFDRIANPETGAQTAFSLLGPYESTEIVDEDTIIVHFSSPFAPFLNSLASPYLSISSPTAIESTPDYGLTTVVGTGPFKLESYIPNSEVILVRNDDYNWGSEEVFGMTGPSAIARIEYRIISEAATRLAALESGEVDLIDSVPELDVARLAEDPAYTMVEIEQPGHGWSYMMNAERWPTDQVAVRRAISQYIDKEGLLNVVYNGLGTPACSALTKVMFGYDPATCDYLPYDPAAADQTLLDDGWVKNETTGYWEKDGERLALQHYYRADSPESAAQATFLQADLAQHGVQLVLNGMSGGGYFDAVRTGQHNSQGWWDTQTDPDGVFRTLMHSSNAGGGTNRNRYVNPEMDALIDQAAGEADVEARAALYADIQRLAADEAVMVYLVDPYMLYAHVANLTGVKYMSGGNIPNFYAASFSS